MKGDFTRKTFRRDKHYSSVRMQQGRVALDADWNEQVEIQGHRVRSLGADLIGPCGAPKDGGGFEIRPSVEAVHPLRKVFFLNENAGWIVGDSGLILTTTDGGKHWTRRESNTTKDLRSVFFVADDRGWVVGRNGTILFTEDGGLTWSLQDSPEDDDLYDVCFVNGSKGWAVGEEGCLLTTNDGGSSWEDQSLGTTAGLFRVGIFKEEVGWAVGKVPSKKKPVFVFLLVKEGEPCDIKKEFNLHFEVRDAFFVSKSKGYIVGTGRQACCIENKRGNEWTWDRCSLGDIPRNLNAVHFCDEYHGWIVGDGGAVWVPARNEQDTPWENRSPKGMDANLTSVFLVSEDAGWVLGKDGTILHTSDRGASWEAQAPNALELDISPGRYYVGGILCENEEARSLKAQQDLPWADWLPEVQKETLEPQDIGRYLAYLDVWERHVTALEDSEIREVALGGPDTATRTQVLSQVKLKWVDGAEESCAGLGGNWKPAESTGTLAARARRQPGDDEPCVVPETAGYTGLENRLYRVEVHGVAKETPGRIWVKWSRDNGSLATRWIGQDGDKLSISQPGRDAYTGFAPGRWVELTDDTRELWGLPGILVPITGVEEETISVDPEQAIVADSPESSGPSDPKWKFPEQFPRNPKLRLWDGVLEFPVQDGPGDWTPLEHGVEIALELRAGVALRNGDYWLIPARTALNEAGDVLWPQDTNDSGEPEPRWQLPDGIQHHYCPLALLQLSGSDSNPSAWTRLEDCRRLFSPLTERPAGRADCCSVTVGDGVTSVGDFRELKAAIDAVDEEGTVCILPGDHRLQGPLAIENKNIIIEGCGRVSRIIYPADESPAIKIHGGSARLTSLRIEPDDMVEVTEAAVIEGDSVSNLHLQGCLVRARSPGVAAVRVNGVTRSLRIEACTIRNEPRYGPAISGPACQIADGNRVVILDNEFVGSPGLAIQARRATVRNNRLQRGGVWVCEGSSDVIIEGNVIDGGDLDTSVGQGPGILLGGLPADSALLGDAAGIEMVRVVGNQIRRWFSNGISTSAQIEENEALGEIADLTIAQNRITECGMSGPDPVCDGAAAAGIVLRNVNGLRIRENQIRDNGSTGKVSACGIFMQSCTAVDVTSNQILNNGSSDPELFRSVGFLGTDPGWYENGYSVQDIISISVFDTSDWEGASDGNFLIENSDPPALRCGVRTRIQLPAARTAWLQLGCVQVSDTVTVVALSDNDHEVARVELSPSAGQTEVFPVQLAAANIVVIEVQVPEDQVGKPETSSGVLLSNIAFGEPGYQAGIAAFGVGGDESSGRHAVRIQDNTVACPRGQALVVCGLDPMALCGNHLVSKGPRIQPPLAPSLESGVLDPIDLLSTLTFLGPCVLAFNAGSRFNPAHRALGLRRSTSGGSGVLQLAAVAMVDAPADGRVLFQGNQISFNLTIEGTWWPTSAFLVSFDDMSAQGNEFTVQGNEFTVQAQAGGVGADVFAMGGTLRVSTNRFAETQQRADFSCISVGFMNLTGDNQGTHCIVPLPLWESTVDRDNQVAFPTDLCDDFSVGYMFVPDVQNRTASAEAWKDAQEQSPGDTAAAVEDLLHQTSRARTAILRACGGEQKRRSKRLLTLADRLKATLGGNHPHVKALRLAASRATERQRSLNAAAERSSRRPAVSADHWLVYGHVGDKGGKPIVGASVRVYDKDAFFDDLLGTTTSDEYGDFYVIYRESDFREIIERQPDLYVRVEDELGRVLYSSEESIRFNASTAEYFEIVVASEDVSSK